MVQYFNLTSVIATNHQSLSLLVSSYPHTLPRIILSSTFLICAGLVWSHLLPTPNFSSPLLSSRPSRRFFRDLRSSLWLQRDWLQRRSAVGEKTSHAVQILTCRYVLYAPFSSGNCSLCFYEMLQLGYLNVFLCYCVISASCVFSFIFFLYFLTFLTLCSRMLTPSTTLRTTESSTYWISAI